MNGSSSVREDQWICISGDIKSKQDTDSVYSLARESL